MLQAFTIASPVRDKASSACLPRIDLDQLLVLAQHLAPPDRAVLRGVYERGMSAAAMAHATGCHPKTMHKRLRRLMQRMASPGFRYVVRHRLDWPPERRAIAEAVVLRGQSHRATAIALNLTRHRVRREVDRIRTLSESAAARTN